MNRGTHSPARVLAMLEVRPSPYGFTVYDTDACEPIITFPTRAEADELVAALQIEEAHAGELRVFPVA